MAAKQTRLFFNTLFAVNKTHDEVVKDIFRPGKFACTVTGCLQLVGIIALVSNLLIVTISNYCRYHLLNRYWNIGTAGVTILNATTLYFIFCCGYVVNNPSLWFKVSIASNCILSIISIIAQSLAMNSCLTLEFVHNSPGPLAIVGGGCLMLSCISLFFLYRYKELDIEIQQIERKRSEDRTGNSSAVQSRKVSPDNTQQISASVPVYPPHIKAHLFVKHDDVKRKCSHCGDETQSPRRKLSVYTRNNEGPANATHLPTSLQNGHCYPGTVMSHIKRKMSYDFGRSQGDIYPQCSKSRRKINVFSEC